MKGAQTSGASETSPLEEQRAGFSEAPTSLLALWVPPLFSAPTSAPEGSYGSQVSQSLQPQEEQQKERSACLDRTAGEVVQLSVGGVYFETTAETLSNAGTSYFSARSEFSRRSGKNGLVVLDRDGDMFRHILNFLRGNTLYIDNVATLQQLLEEADFFCIASLKVACMQKIEKILKEREDEREDLKRCLMDAIKEAAAADSAARTHHSGARAGPPKVRRIGEGPLDRGLVFSMTEDF